MGPGVHRSRPGWGGFRLRPGKTVLARLAAKSLGEAMREIGHRVEARSHRYLTNIHASTNQKRARILQLYESVELNDRTAKMPVEQLASKTPSDTAPPVR